MSSDFKKLNLDRSLLKGSIQKYWEDNSCQYGEYIESTPKLHRVSYVENECPVLVEFQLIKDGTTTIHYKTGKHRELGIRLAQHLRKELVNDDRKAVNLVVPDIDAEVFGKLLMFLGELDTESSDLAGIALSQRTEDENKRIIEATSTYKDRLILTHYPKNGKLHIQGKPLYGYSQVTYFLSEYTDFNGFLSILSKGEAESNRVDKGEAEPNRVDVNATPIESELRSSMPNAYDRLGEKTLKLIKTSYMLRSAQMELPDYSSYVYPVLRALEGVIRELLSSKEVYAQTLPRKFGTVFVKKNGAFVVSSEYDMRFNDDSFCRALEQCYDYYYQNRHRLFHMDDNTYTSKLIPTKQEAVQSIDRVIGIIDKSYQQIV